MTPDSATPAGPDEPALRGRSRLAVALKVFYVVSAVFVLLAVHSTLDRSRGRSVPSVGAVLLSFAFCVAALRASASGWAALLPGRASRHALRRAMYVSQPGKYIPGGIVQGAGQVGLTTRAGVPLRDAAPAFIVYAAYVAFASLVVGGVLVTQEATVGPRWAIAGGLGLLAAVPLHRGLVERLIRTLTRLVARLSRIGPLPSQRALGACFGAQVLFAVGQGAAYTVVLRSIAPEAPLVASGAAHAFAFGIGLLAIPVPSGLLVREGLLIAILQSSVPGGTVVTAAIFQRLINIAAEMALIAGSWAAARLRPELQPLPREEP